jgi:hypothetical protein
VIAPGSHPKTAISTAVRDDSTLLPFPTDGG